MRNVTLAIEDEVLASVRKYAASRGTTVNALVRELLKRIATEEDKAANARERLIELSERSSGSLPSDWAWDRAKLYEDRLHPRHEHSDLRGFGEGERGAEKKKGE